VRKRDFSKLKKGDKVFLQKDGGFMWTVKGLLGCKHNECYGVVESISTNLVGLHLFSLKGEPITLGVKMETDWKFHYKDIKEYK